MTLRDRFAFAWRAITAYPLRSALTLLAMAVATCSVMLLNGLGESARQYVIEQFTELGTHLLIVLPGRNETRGGPPPLLGETPRDLTLDDALVLLRSPVIVKIAPIVVGAAPVQYQNHIREANILGTTNEFLSLRHLEMAQGRFLPIGDPHRGQPVVVLGLTLKKELFATGPALGQWLRIGNRRFRVIGILKSSGQAFGEQLDEIAIIPVASAQSLFDVPGLFRIVAQARSRADLPKAKQDIETILESRHEGQKDVTILTSDAILAAFDRILRSLTLAVAGIAAISLLVAGILIMNVMLISVTQRQPEIGLLMALGASTTEVLKLFLTEALLLSLCGAALGAFPAFLIMEGLDRLWPQISMQIAPWSLPAAVAVSISTGLLFGLLPARKAARLDPVVTLHPH